ASGLRAIAGNGYARRGDFFRVTAAAARLHSPANHRKGSNMQTRLVIFLAALGAAGCAGTMAKPPETATSRLASTGVSPREVAVRAGTYLQFVNDDVRPHEIYSNDCLELGSTALAPGQSFVAAVDVGPKLCHFQDLLAPSASEFWGTVKVAAPPPSPDFQP